MGLFNDVGDQTIHRQPGPAGPEGPARPAGPQGPPGFKKTSDGNYDAEDWQISRSVLIKKMQQTRSMLMINSLLS